MNDVTPMMEGYHCCPKCGQKDRIERSDSEAEIATYQCTRCNKFVGACDIGFLKAQADRSRMDWLEKQVEIAQVAGDSFWWIQFERNAVDKPESFRSFIDELMKREEPKP